MGRAFTRTTATMVAVGACVLLLVGQSFAQGGSRSYPVGRRIEEMNRQTEQYDRELTRHGEKKGESVDRKRSRATTTQVRDDFQRIQTIYNEIVLAMSGGKTLDDKFTAEAVEGINKTANRLRENLALPRIEDKDKHPRKGQDINEFQLSASLKSLCTHISDFVTNPLFASTGVLDVDLTFKASRDLNEIIELSDALKKKTGKPHRD
jgi:hypothetical protein